MNVRHDRWEEDEDSEDDDEEDRVLVQPNGCRIIFTATPRGAANHLEGAEGITIDMLEVTGVTKPRFYRRRLPNDDDRSIINRNNSPAARHFRRFVAALEEAGGAEGRAVLRGIRLKAVEWGELAEEDVERLFRDVLPRHPTLQLIGVDAPPRCVSMLAGALLPADAGSHPLRKLNLYGPHDRYAAQSIANMVRRNVPLSELIVTGGGQGATLEAADGNVIAQAVARNPNVRTLFLQVKDVHEDTLEDLMASSSLKKLVLTTAGTLSEEFVARFSYQLRTNAALEDLSINSATGGGSASRLLKAIAAVLQTYNVTIRSVSYNYQEGRTIGRYLARNRWIRGMVAQLEPRNYHVEPMSAWPLAVGKVRGLPTLVYRFVRRGYVNALSQLAPASVAAPGAAATVRNRSTREDDEEGRPRCRRRRRARSRFRD